MHRTSDPKFVARQVASIVVALSLLSGCGRPSRSREILNKEVFFAAAKKCDALNPQFTFYAQGKLPTISFAERSPATGECLADALKNYRYASMTITASDNGS